MSGHHNQIKKSGLQESLIQLLGLIQNSKLPERYNYEKISQEKPLLLLKHQPSPVESRKSTLNTFQSI